VFYARERAYRGRIVLGQYCRPRLENAESARIINPVETMGSSQLTDGDRRDTGDIRTAEPSAARLALGAPADATNKRNNDRAPRG